MINFQYDLFETAQETELKALQKHIDKLEAAIDRQRKSQFAKIGENTKRIGGLEERFEAIERFICKGVTI